MRTRSSAPPRAASRSSVVGERRPAARPRPRRRGRRRSRPTSAGRLAERAPPAAAPASRAKQWTRRPRRSRCPTRPPTGSGARRASREVAPPGAGRRSPPPARPRALVAQHGGVDAAGDRPGTVRAARRGATRARRRRRPARPSRSRRRARQVAAAPSSSAAQRTASRSVVACPQLADQAPALDLAGAGQPPARRAQLRGQLVGLADAVVQLGARGRRPAAAGGRRSRDVAHQALVGRR